MAKNVIVKLLVAGAAMFGAYKLLKAVDEKQKEEAEKVRKHRETVLEEIDAELHEAEEWKGDTKDLTLNNVNLKPADRAYAYQLYKERFDAINNAKTIAAIDEARKEFEELIDILMNVTEAETIETIFKIDQDKKQRQEQLRKEKALRETELEKYRAISDVIEKIGTRVVCGLVQ